VRVSRREDLRTVRGGLLALASAGLAITAHALAGGGPPDTAVTLVLTGLVGWTGAALAEKTRGPIGVLAVLGTAQLAMHLVLSGLMAHAAPSGGMFLTHAAATAVTAVVLSHAETMLLAAAASLLLLVPVVWRPAPVPAGPAPLPIRPAADEPTVSVLLRRIHRRRGPPARS
jgi:hypothetical protein